MLNTLSIKFANKILSLFLFIFLYFSLFSTNIGGKNTIYNDTPEPWGIGFQDGVSPGFTGVIDLHNNIFFYLVVIAILVFWMLGSTIYYFNFDKTKITHKYLVHGTLIEILWTIFPAIVLLAIAIPSFRLLYILDEVTLPTITVKVTGHQWYWSYEYSDYETESGDPIEFDSYMIPESDLEIGQTRLLEVDNPIVLPENTHVRFLVTSTDVLHDFAVPSAAIKIDAAPGRLNQASFFSEREGELFGQCSELCGTYHGFMPIQIEVGSVEDYLSWISSLTILSISTKNKINYNLLFRTPLNKAKSFGSKEAQDKNSKSLKSNSRLSAKVNDLDNKNNFNSIIIGFKKGYSINTLPDNIRIFLDYPVIRILRVIGGFSVIFYLMNKNGIISYNLPYYLNIIITIFAFIQLVQIIIISVIKFVYSLNKLIRNRKELEVRNSPLNECGAAATVTANLVYCF
jgi:cytochrome c oxidase subunit 2